MDLMRKTTSSGTCRLAEIIDTHIPQPKRQCNPEELQPIDEYFAGHCQAKKGDSEMAVRGVFEATDVVLSELQSHLKPLNHLKPKKKAAGKA